ncbi:lamin tail domain-containing protein [Candidatus Poseidoniaceae archaeon]|nr:lamin tail domain-containing protein [Euryarchaeota archaeon]MDA9156195.1 lamin tail domain-containing protein [Candidatus Poseidoniaceae archaeon]MDC3267934.1 lamin tail domain-containing protein [bacterium]MDA8594514.1 lamin tail domain-containing protein [Euryarchaeota archaeon]MDA8610575.1 lamin tail domain-containing protein [Euryarchaeota archaeon]
MRGVEVCSLERDNNALTAVIEFLSAFALFLMILTAFLSLAQLQMGSNDPDVDRIDRAAVQGMDRLTSDGGWFVPMGSTGLDFNNSTSEWHLLDAVSLDNGRVQTGLVSEGILDEQRIEALRNVSEENMALGLGLDVGYTLYLSISVIESENASRVGVKLFTGGTDRSTATASSSANRQFSQNGEILRVILEVHRGGQKDNDLYLSEVMLRPTSFGPEWVEIYNPNDFALSLRGWSLNHTSTNGASNLLFQEGVISGHSTVLFTGDATSQSSGNASQVFDLSQESFLGVGSINLLNDGNGVLSLRYTQLDQARPYDVMTVEWGAQSDLFTSLGQSLEATFNGTQASWAVQTSPTPGSISSA